MCAAAFLLGLLLDAVKHLPGVGHEQDPLRLASFPLFRIDRVIIRIAQVNAAAALFRNTRRQRDLNARRLDVRFGIEGARAFDMRAVRFD